jgi:hypothetical protein
MKLAIVTVAVLVCLCGMKGIRADFNSYGGSYGTNLPQATDKRLSYNVVT